MATQTAVSDPTLEARERRAIMKATARSMLVATVIAFVVPAIISTAVAVGYSRSAWTDGVRWSLYMVAAASLAAIIGLIFGVPRARADFKSQPSERYESNSNLEQISDWLTKLLVGAGLVELKSVPQLFSNVGSYLGAGMEIPNAEAFSVTAVAYGSGVGFGLGYLWARLLLRFLLEMAEKFAAEESTLDQIMNSLRSASKDKTSQEPEHALVAAAEKALRTAEVSSAFLPILWVDDTPSNNTPLVDALHALGIGVDQALSTAAAMEALNKRSYGLVISDLGRSENGQWHERAGLELIESIRNIPSDVPIFIFGTRRAVEMREELELSGAALVTNRASVLFEQAVATCARGA
jgi:CheY-like chemotaxis protein